MQNIATLLGKKYKSELRYFRAVEIIQKNWSSVVKDLSRVLTPKNIYKNELVIECSNPVWMSEIDCFKKQIVMKVNQLLVERNLKLTIIGIKPIFNADMVFNEVKSTVVVPNSIEERIGWNVKNKQKNGARLCISCHKIWDQSETCRLCQLTVE